MISIDPFTRKEWYDVKAPAMFNVRNVGKTLVTRTIGTSKYLVSYFVEMIEIMVTGIVSNFSTAYIFVLPNKFDFHKQ